MNRKRAAFTLVELLAVIAIILLLLSLLAPVLGIAREKGQRAVCTSNQRQIFAGLLGYALEHDGQMPAGNATVSPNFGIDSTYAVAYRLPMGTALLMGGLTNSAEPGVLTSVYLDNNTSLFYCPTWWHPFFRHNVKYTVGIGEYGGWTRDGTKLPKDHVGISYIYRSTFAQGPKRWNPPNTRLAKPARTAILSDHWYLWVYDNVWYGQFTHRVGYIAAYLDGHVAWKPDPDLFMYYSPVRNGSWDDQERRWQVFFDN